MRARLLSDQPIANADKTDELVGALGNHGGAIDRLIRSIDHLTPILQSQGNEEAVKRLEVIAWRLEEICARSLEQATTQYVVPFAHICGRSGHHAALSPTMQKKRASIANFQGMLLKNGFLIRS